MSLTGRSTVWHRGRAVLLAAGVLAAAAVTAQGRDLPGAQPAPVTLDLTPDAARLASVQSLRSGRLDAARQMSLAILQRDPDDLTALLVMAAAGAKTGHEAMAAMAGRRAFRLSNAPTHRFEAAYLTAAALDRQNRPLRSQLWLRRAAEAAPSPEYRALALRSFHASRQAAKLRLGVDLALEASDNVNDGSLQDVMWIIGLPFDVADALPGTVGQMVVTADYRLQQSATSQTVLRVGLAHQAVRLTAEARRRDPAARSADFAQGGFQIGVTHWTRPWADVPVMLSLGVSAGQTWQAGRKVSRDTGLRLGADWTISPSTTLIAQVSGTQRRHLTNARRSSDLASLDLTAVHQTAASGTLRIGVFVADTHSAALDLRHRSVGASLGWQPDWQPLGITPDLSMRIEQKDYTRLGGLAPEIGLSALASVTLTRLDYMGFAPSLSVRAERNRSDFVPRDRRGISLGLGIVSTF